MSQNDWGNHVGDLHNILTAVSCRLNGKEIDMEAGFEKWKTFTMNLRNDKGTIYLIGNGASASMASHLAADLAKNAHLHTEVFSDLSLITAISNDMGFDNVFAEPLRRRARTGDILVAISSSGRSQNILDAVKAANEMNMTVVTLSAMNSDNPLRKTGTINIYVSAQTYGSAETCHAAILHYWMDMVEIS